MGRYVDADSLIRTLYIQADNDGFICCGVEDLETLIKTQLTEDVRENVRGEWIKDENGDITCTNCGCHLEDWVKAIFYNFCPNCGADVRGR